MKTERKHILLVEDEAVIALAGRKLLEKNGYDVVHAPTGEAALQAVVGQIDLVLMDIDLGPGIKGTEAAQRILAARDLPIVFLTSNISREMMTSIRGITHYGYISKAAGEFTLVATIETALALFETHSSEKDAFLHDVHHRFKRGIEVIEGLLSLEADETADRGAATALRDARRRLFALRTLYEKQSSSPKNREVSAREYLEGLAIGLARSHTAGREIAVETYVEDIPLSIGQLLPLGMIVQELISISLEHAFPDGRAGMISLAAYRDAGSGIEVVISDDGIDMTADGTEIGGLGIELVRGLAKQISATIERRRRGGTTYRIRFSPTTET